MQQTTLAPREYDPGTTCHCGQPLHYPAGSQLKLDMEMLTNDLGHFIVVEVAKRKWWVQRHYIALHGIKGKDVAALGFVEVTN